ncbi:quaternary ammonium compound efflux SMR transporter SugE [Paracoccus zhejiangensis]|uniref:Guanidinium exporter n=1 Tax=Paracoccus zhejiangensis TaxID=1077935 RepID=A0A2H5EZI6_9RHOB|nr:quaternary ammonium compound efflux SMR transporter SugE [Paracoccus zhejiangensis]AUH64718.1 quaternary ammonium compound-resistance protein SugE [Paracoccus zhejiangensis]
MNPWVLLTLAGLLEVVWALSLKYSDGFTRLVPSIVTIIAAAASFWLLAAALRHLPAGTAYAVWTGIGALGVAVLGILWLGESTAPLKLAGIGLIVAGIAALKLA